MRREKLESKFKEMIDDDEFISNVCLSYRHDFGLLPPEVQATIQIKCKQWLIAMSNNIHVLYRNEIGIGDRIRIDDEDIQGVVTMIRDYNMVDFTSDDGKEYSASKDSCKVIEKRKFEEEKVYTKPKSFEYESQYIDFGYKGIMDNIDNYSF